MGSTRGTVGSAWRRQGIVRESSESHREESLNSQHVARRPKTGQVDSRCRSEWREWLTWGCLPLDASGLKLLWACGYLPIVYQHRDIFPFLALSPSCPSGGRNKDIALFFKMSVIPTNTTVLTLLRFDVWKTGITYKKNVNCLGKVR